MESLGNIYSEMKQIKKLNTTKKAVNRLFEVLESKGVKELRPDDSNLERLGIKIHTWNKWIAKKSDPELWQLKIIAESILQCEISQLLNNHTDTSHNEVRARHGIVIQPSN